jgi:hypothetical protein
MAHRSLSSARRRLARAALNHTEGSKHHAETMIEIEAAAVDFASALLRDAIAREADLTATVAFITKKRIDEAE